AGAAHAAPSAHLTPGGTMPVDFTFKQQRNGAIIVAAAGAWAGTVGMGHRSRSLAAGLLANAWAESRWDDEAVGDSGTSFGLFQLHDSGEVGPEGRALGDVAMQHGLTRAQLADARANSEVMAWACLRESHVLEALRSGTLADVTTAITVYVERPAGAQA